MNKEIKDKLDDLHGKLLNGGVEMSLTSDTGDMSTGVVVYTVSCKKKDLLEKLRYLEDVHRKGFPVK